MITYETGKTIADVLFFGGSAVAMAGLFFMKRDITRAGAMFASNGVAIWLLNGAAWFLSH